MLEEIRVRNFAIIDQLELTFGEGLNVITGETGAGKSIIIDAVELLLGAKADPAMVRAGEERAIIEGVFRLSQGARLAVLPILERENLLEDGGDHTVTIMREIRANGRSSARVGGVTVSIDVISEIGEFLVDVHGQSAHLSVLKAAAHLDLLDRYAGLMDARDALSMVVGRLAETRREIADLVENEAQLERRSARLRDELEEIEAAELQPDEEETLRSERQRLANSEQLARFTSETISLLYGDEVPGGQESAVDQLVQVAALMAKLKAIDASLQEEYDLAETAVAQVEELALSMRRYVDSIEHSPDRLDEVEERLELVNSLKRRFGAASIEEIFAYAERARAELEGIDHSAERLDALREQETSLLKHVGELSERISRARLAAARRLSEGIVNELADLRMEKAQFEVSIMQQEDPQGCYVGERRLAFTATGIDQVEFMMSANPGEPLRPLAKVASGGEAARIMLALKRVLTQADQTPTLIFDEIDQGIGGRVGSVVGRKLWELTGEHQVLVVTHMAQLAGFADRHFRVFKQIDGGRTHTQIVSLDSEEQRVEELAAMLGTINEPGVLSARELLHEARHQKMVGKREDPPAPLPLP
ncbi:MAG: DNA repair protein RecN [Anaerolineae bacterium]|nr:DNA repair protein RecN [Anaerolineae bacterium]NUQ03137.1 DNA repair protein RecN [Anaerolineae bacterium]